MTSDNLEEDLTKITHPSLQFFSPAVVKVSSSNPVSEPLPPTTSKRSKNSDNAEDLRVLSANDDIRSTDERAQ
ncbi:hypothetical protein FRB99_000725 [Tulasnella sp. 403]|nr:hypothetical protein FRB99_000725 [Tulasnella sp. 403]